MAYTLSIYHCPQVGVSSSGGDSQELESQLRQKTRELKENQEKVMFGGPAISSGVYNALMTSPNDVTNHTFSRFTRYKLITRRRNKRSRSWLTCWRRRTRLTTTTPRRTRVSGRTRSSSKPRSTTCSASSTKSRRTKTSWRRRWSEMLLRWCRLVEQSRGIPNFQREYRTKIA